MSHKVSGWEQGGAQYPLTVGALGREPIQVYVSVTTIDNVLVCFYEPLGYVTDSRVIEKWFSSNCPAFDKHNTNAWNFTISFLNQ